jgi:recombinational DNA repair protein RecR
MVSPSQVEAEIEAIKKYAAAGGTMASYLLKSVVLMPLKIFKIAKGLGLGR